MKQSGDTPLALPRLGSRWPVLPLRFKRQMTATIKPHHRRAPMLPINTGSCREARTWETSRLWLSDSRRPPLWGSEEKAIRLQVNITSVFFWIFNRITVLIQKVTTKYNKVHLYSLMTNPWGSLSIPTPAPLTAAMVIQYCFPCLSAEMSRLCWPLFTVQFWYCCSSDPTHHT